MSILILNEDYLDSATRTVSSEQADFPDSNLYDQSQRGDFWRSNGYFLITSANKGIVFQETNSVNLTANIAEAAYTSLSSFLTAVKTALDAAGDSTYTVSQNTSTKKITIVSNGSGGGGILKLMWTNVGSTAYDVLGFSNSADDTGSLTYSADVVRIHTEEWLKWDLGASSNPDIFIAIGRKNDAIKLSASATIKLQGNTTDSWTSPAYDQTLTYDEISLIKIKTEGDNGLHTSALRYWRLSIIDRDNSNGYIELSSIYLGEYYATTQGQPQFPFKVNSIDYSSESRFDSGAVAFNRRDRSESFSFDWLGLTTTEKEVFDTLYRDVGTSKFFFIVYDKDLAFSSNVNYSARYVVFSRSPGMSLVTPGVWDASWDLEEVI